MKSIKNFRPYLSMTLIRIKEKIIAETGGITVTYDICSRVISSRNSPDMMRGIEGDGHAKRTPSMNADRLTGTKMFEWYYVMNCLRY